MINAYKEYMPGSSNRFKMKRMFFLDEGTIDSNIVGRGHDREYNLLSKYQFVGGIARWSPFATIVEAYL